MSKGSRKGFKQVLVLLLLVVFSVFPASHLCAGEGGGNHYPGGTEDFMIGAIPPPGMYFLNYFQNYTANKLKDNSGHKIPVDFEVDAIANGFRFLHVTKTKVMGGDVFWHGCVPVVHQHVSLRGFPGERSQSKTGLGDVELGTGIVWHGKNFHGGPAIDVMVPTGSYNKDDLANIGRNYFTINPIFALTYLSDKGFEVSGKFMYMINTTNYATGYRSGDEFAVDYSVGQHIKNWTIGASGHYLKQVTDDKMRNEPSDFNGNRGTYFSIGPAVQYAFKNMFVTAKYQWETNVKNRSQGQALWLRFFYAF
jgi:hypothetical protein